MTSNRPLEEWGKLLGDVPTAGAILDHLLHARPVASALLSHVDPRRFSDSGMRASIEISVPLASAGTNTMSDEVMLKLLNTLKSNHPQSQVIDIPASEPKQIADAGTKPPKE
jgi:hypothetical protein